MTNLNLKNSRGLSILLAIFVCVFCLTGCAETDLFDSCETCGPNPGKETIDITYIARPNLNGDKGDIDVEAIVSCKQDGKVTFSQSHPMSVAIAMDHTPAEWWLTKRLTAGDANPVSANNPTTNGTITTSYAKWSYGKDREGNNMIISANSGFQTLTGIETCQMDTVLKYGVTKMEIRNFEDIKVYDKIEKYGQYWTPVDRKFIVRYYLSNPTQDGSTYVELSQTFKNYEPGAYVPVDQTWEDDEFISLKRDCEKMFDTWKFNLIDQDNKKSLRELKFPFVFKAVPTATGTITRENGQMDLSFNSGSSNLIGGAATIVETVTHTDSTSSITSKKTYSTVFAGGLTIYWTPNYTSAHKFNNGYSTSVDVPAPVLVSAYMTIVSSTPTTGGTNHGVKFVSVWEYNGCSYEEDLCTTVFEKEKGTTNPDPEFDYYQNASGKIECDGSGYITATEVWTDKSTKSVRFEWTASDVTLGFSLGNIQNPILRDDANIGQGNVNNGTSSVNSTKTIQNYLQIAQKTQNHTASYNGGFSIGLTSNYPEFSLVRNGKTYSVSGVNKTWTIVSSTTVGNKTTVGNTDKYPVNFNFSGTLNGDCETKKTGNSEIHVTKEAPITIVSETWANDKLVPNGTNQSIASAEKTTTWSNGRVETETISVYYNHSLVVPNDIYKNNLPDLNYNILTAGYAGAAVNKGTSNGGTNITVTNWERGYNTGLSSPTGCVLTWTEKYQANAVYVSTYSTHNFLSPNVASSGSTTKASETTTKIVFDSPLAMTISGYTNGSQPTNLNGTAHVTLEKKEEVVVEREFAEAYGFITFDSNANHSAGFIFKYKDASGKYIGMIGYIGGTEVGRWTAAEADIAKTQTLVKRNGSGNYTPSYTIFAQGHTNWVSTLISDGSSTALHRLDEKDTTGRGFLKAYVAGALVNPSYSGSNVTCNIEYNYTNNNSTTTGSSSATGPANF